VQLRWTEARSLAWQQLMQSSVDLWQVLQRTRRRWCRWSEGTLLAARRLSQIVSMSVSYRMRVVPLPKSRFAPQAAMLGLNSRLHSHFFYWSSIRLVVIDAGRKVLSSEVCWTRTTVVIDTI
jgi:hypothetical protein